MYHQNKRRVYNKSCLGQFRVYLMNTIVSRTFFSSRLSAMQRSALTKQRINVITGAVSTNQHTSLLVG